MPWKAFKENDEWCVYKHDAQGNKIGDALGCHPSEGAAQRQIAALNINVKEAEDKKPVKTQIFVEAVELVEGTLNPQTREVEAVLIRPGWSANGRYYSRDVLAKAAALYEGSRAFADHPTADQLRRGEGRSVTHLTGRFHSVRVGDGGELRAIRKVYDNPAGNAVWPAIVDAVETKSSIIGLSINAVGKASAGTHEGRSGVIVEEITAVNSVDDVIAPAAGGGFERLIASGDALLASVLEAMTYEEFIAARPDYLDTLKKQMKRERQDETVRAAHDKLAEAQTKLSQTTQQVTHLTEQAQEDRATIHRLQMAVTLEQAFRKANLPPTIENEIRTQLEHAQPQEWLAILEREQRIVKAAGGKPVPVPVSGAPQRVHQPTLMEARPDAPINMDLIRTPEDLAAELRRRSNRS